MCNIILDIVVERSDFMLSNKTYIQNRQHYNQKSIDEIRDRILNLFNRTLEPQERAYYSHCIYLMKSSQKQTSEIEEEVLSEVEIKHFILLANCPFFNGQEYSILYNTIHPVENDRVKKVAV